MDILFLLLKGLIMLPVVWLLMLITIFFHEMGHVVMYLLLYRENDWSVELGKKGIKLVKFGRFTIYISMVTGCAYYSYTNYNKFKSILVSFGGPLVNLILVILFKIYLSNSSIERSYFFIWCVYFLFYSNLFQFLGTIIPIKTVNYSSDGMKILQRLKGKLWLGLFII